MCCKNEPIIARAADIRLRATYNINNALNFDLLRSIITEGNQHFIILFSNVSSVSVGPNDKVIEQGLSLEGQGRISSARELYINHGKTEEETRVNFVAQYVKDHE